MVAALEAGVTLFDTADVYNPPGKGAGHSERLVRRALASWAGDQDAIVIATKGGKYWDAAGEVVVDGRPSYLRQACEASLCRLGTESLSLYFLHEPDPQVPFEESVGALGDLQQEGKIRLVGVSNVSLEQLETACRVVPVVAVQNRYSPVYGESAPQLGRCTALGIAFLPWAPLGGLKDPASSGTIGRRFSALAEEREVSVYRLAIAWAPAQSPVVVPIPRASRPESVLDDVEAPTLELGPDELDWLNGKSELTGPGEGLTQHASRAHCG
jgi:aryl-alcohol dehydrogenase-like predicted oxidoreductase